MKRKSIAFAVLVAFTLAIALPVRAAQPSHDDKLNALLKHVPADAPMVVAIPSMKRLNDDLVELLGGMDRADLAAVGRPIDMAKSVLGLGGGVDDRGGAAFVITITDGAPAPVALVPVTDPKGFVATNFKPNAETGGYTNSNGNNVFIRELGDNYMLLGDSKEAVEGYQPGDGAAAAMKERFGASAETFFRSGEVLILLDQSGARFFATQFSMPGAVIGAGMPPDADAAADIAKAREALLTQIAGLGYAIDVDPLGVVVRGLTQFESGSELGKAMQGGGKTSSTWMQMLPSKAYYAAAGIDLKAAGALNALDAIAPLLQIDLAGVRDVLTNAEHVAFIASPSPAGMQGGLLNDSAVVIRTRDAAAMHAAVRSALDKLAAIASERMAAMSPDGNAPPIEIAWKEKQEVGDEKLTADAYEISAPPGGDMMAMMARSLVFGQRQRGFVASTDHAVVITFSQRPAVLAAAMKSAEGNGPSLADDTVLTAVRQWMGAPSPIELYIHLGQLNKFAVTVAKSFGQGNMQLPELDPKGPPIGVHIGAADHGLTHTLALPAPVLADILREFERFYRPMHIMDVDDSGAMSGEGESGANDQQ